MTNIDEAILFGGMGFVIDSQALRIRENRLCFDEIDAVFLKIDDCFGFILLKSQCHRHKPIYVRDHCKGIIRPITLQPPAGKKRFFQQSTPIMQNGLMA